VSVDDLVPEIWLPEVIQALDAWRQGQLIKGFPIVWATVGGSDPVTGLEVPGIAGGWRAQITSGTSSPLYGVVASQTCDIACVGPGARHPTVQVSPARNVTDDFPNQKKQQVRSHELAEYVWLTHFPEPGDWVVDLRISVPVSKGVLAGRQPLDCFATDDDALVFAERVAQKVRRPALHDSLTTGMVPRLRTFLLSNRKEPEWFEKVEQVRIRVHGPRLAPTAIQAVVICESALSTCERQTWRTWQKAEKKKLAKLGIKLQPILFRTLSDLSVEIYRDSVPVSLPELGRRPYW
jgi:hypothetical protein